MNSGSALRFLTRFRDGGSVAVAIPPGVSRLSFPVSAADRRLPVITSTDMGPERPSQPGLPGATLEVVRGGFRPLVLLSGEGKVDVRLNGLPAPRLAALGLRDEVRVGEQEVLYLTVWREPQLGPAAEGRRNEKCPVCFTGIGPGNAYLCSCGHLLHLNGDEVPEKARLQCARAVPICTACEEEIKLLAGYLFEPEV